MHIINLHDAVVAACMTTSVITDATCQDDKDIDVNTFPNSTTFQAKLFRCDLKHKNIDRYL